MALACLGLDMLCLDLALVLLPIQFKPFRESEAIGSLACLALARVGMSCLGLGMPCLGLGIAPFKAFRESEAIGSLAWRGLGMPCLGLRWHVVPWPWHALAWPWHCPIQGISRKLGYWKLGMAWPWLALACRALALACLGIGIAPFKAFRESEAIGSLAWRGLGLRWHVVLGLGVPWPWHALASACLALALACLALRWHAPWHALAWLGLGIARHFESEAIGSLTWQHALPCVGMPRRAVALACLALACLALALQGISRVRLLAA